MDDVLLLRILVEGLIGLQKISGDHWEDMRIRYARQGIDLINQLDIEAWGRVYPYKSTKQIRHVRTPRRR